MPKFDPGYMAVLKDVPPFLLAGLPEDDQTAILAIIGRPVMVIGHSFGHTEVEFLDADGATHSIWVETALLS